MPTRTLTLRLLQFWLNLLCFSITVAYSRLSLGRESGLSPDRHVKIGGTQCPQGRIVHPAPSKQNHAKKGADAKVPLPLLGPAGPSGTQQQHQRRDQKDRSHKPRAGRKAKLKTPKINERISFALPGALTR